MKKLLAALPFLLVSLGAYANPLEEELLEPEQAFALSTRVLDAETVEAKWTIADGYYLYRNKFRFEALDGGAPIRESVIPPGVKKHDEFFGEVETFRKAVTVTLKLAPGANDGTARLRLHSQGCADVGVCYQPQAQTVELKLPPQAAAREKTDSLGVLGRLLQPREQAFLEPDQAFVLTVEPVDAGTLRARFRIADGYYLYRDKTRFALSEGAGAALGTYELPRGKVKADPYFGDTEVYYGQAEVLLPFVGGATQAELVANYQGCAEKGICYPPTTKKVVLDLGGATPLSLGPTDAAGGIAPRAGFIALVIGAFGIGLALTFTPCVLPMIPILSSIIVGQGGTQISKLRGGLLSGAYVLGTAVTYTAAGVLAGATGDQLQAYFQNPWAIGLFSLLFVLLALAMFGFYDLQMPSFIQSRLQNRTQSVRGGSLFGVFFLGLVSALIVGACVSPLLISALGVAITSRDPVLGGAIMFAMALGMGVILVAIGVGAGFLLPKAGSWMNTVKQVFGVLLLAVAIYLLTAIPAVPVLLLWAVLLIVTAVYLGATQSLPREAGGWAYLWKGVGTFLLIWGVLALIGGFAGSRDILRPLPVTAYGFGSGEAGPAAAAPAEALFMRVTSVSALDAQLARAQAEGRPALVDYYATWCTDCVRMEKATFSDPRVRQALGRFALIQADVTDNTEETRALKQRLRVLGPPAMVFFTSGGEERADLRFYGFKGPEQFLAMLEQL